MKINRKIIFTLILITIILSISTITVKAIINDKIGMENKDLENTKILEANLSDKYENLLGKENPVTYKYSNDDVKVYEDNNNTEYLLKNESLIGFIKEIEPRKVALKIKSRGISEQHAYEIANTYCESNIRNFEQYILIENKYIETYKEYNIVFNKKIGEYQTMDLIFIAINTQGEITAFVAPNQGEFDEYKNVKTDNAEISNFIAIELNNKYGNDLKNFIEKEKTFKIINNKLVLECSVKIKLTNGFETLDTVCYYI